MNYVTSSSWITFTLNEFRVLTKNSISKHSSKKSKKRGIISKTNKTSGPLQKPKTEK